MTLLTAALCGAFAGTAHAQRATQQPFSPQPVVPDPGRREVYTEALREIEAPTCTISSWNEAFTEAKSLSTDLHIALGAMQAAEGNVRAALGSLLPNVNGSVTFGVSGATATSAQTQLGLSLTASQSIIDLAAWESLAASRTDQRSVELSSVDVKRALAIALANTLFGVLTAERVAQINRDSLVQAVERLEIAERRTELGGGTALDIVRARQDAELALALVVDANESARRAREALGLALGHPEACTVRGDVELESLTEFGETCHEVELAARADLAALKEATRAAEQRETSVWRGFLPSLRLDASLGNTNFFGTPSSSVASWIVQGVLVVPIWDGGSRYGALRSAAAQRQIADEQLEAARRNAVIEVTRARRAVDVANASLDASRASRNDAEQVERLARAGFQQGISTSLDLISSASQLRAAEIDLAIRELQLISARMLAVLTIARCS